jgi:hypothetical protein
VKGVQFLVNSRVDPTANTFSLFDEVIMADVGGAGLSRNYLSIPPVLIPIQQGPGTDRLALGFESLHLAPRVQVVLNMIRTHCFECHAGTQPARINLSAGIDEASLINILRDYDGAGARPPWPLVIPLQPSRSPLSLALSGTSAAQRSLPASTNPTYGAATVSVSRMTPDSAAFMLGVPAGDRNRYRDEMKRIVDYWIFNLGKP